jgi:hypothetical protein
MSDSASFRNTSAQLLCINLAFFGVTRNSDCHRLSCGSFARNIGPLHDSWVADILLYRSCLLDDHLAKGFYE